MSSVYIEFQFSDDSSTIEEFEADIGLLNDIEEFAEETASDLSVGCDEEIGCIGWAISEVDTDYTEQAGPEEFNDLDEWAEYCQDCEKHGEAYVLRYADIGEHDFDDEYQGCFRSTVEFVQHIIEECYDIDIPDFLVIDWDSTADAIMMDYSEYSGREGTHIFRC